MFDRLLAALLAPCCTAAMLASVPGPSGTQAHGALDGDRAAATPVASSRDIAGEWDIVSFRDHRPARRLAGAGRAAFADFAHDGVALHIECNYSGASGRVVDGRFKSTPGDRAQTLIGCGPEREARDAALFGFFDRNPVVEQLGDGRVRLTAGDDTLVLERPARRRLAYLPSPGQLLGEWRLLAITHYVPGGGIASTGLSDVPGRIAFDGIEAGYTPCPQLDIAYRYAPEGRIERFGGSPLPAQGQGCEALQAAPVGPDMPTPWDVMAVLHANPLVELVDDQTILLSTERHGLLLTKRPPEV